MIMENLYLNNNTPSSNFKTKLAIIAIGSLLVLGIVGLLGYNSIFGAPQTQAEFEQFTVPLPTDQRGGTLIDFTVANDLKNKGFIKNEWGFKYALGAAKVEPGAYKISKSMNAFKLASALKKGPYMKWVVIPEGLRKEQIAELLASDLGWGQDVKTKWITVYTSLKYDEIEGIYFPDTYLIPADEDPLKVADRLRAKFNEKFQPYANEALKQNIKWTTALRLASVVQREAAGKDDMPLIAGILWNRLLKDMKLEVDATIQYVRDDQIHYGEVRYDKQPLSYISDGGWWSQIKSGDKDIQSPYNTYRNKGLPPHPISNPGIDAIEAVLSPEETECLYYLHDSSRVIHCAKTYEEHQENIVTYLKK